jgi:HNH endonuclease
MPEKFKPNFRRALWEAHGRVCSYCGNPLNCREFQVDHLLPQKYSSDLVALEEIKKQAGLAADFSLQGLENLLPSCRMCNSKKRDSIFLKQRLIFFLEIAARKKHIVEKLVSRFDREDQSDTLQEQLISSLKTGKIKVEEIQKAVKDCKSSQGIFDFSRGFTLDNCKTILLFSLEKMSMILSYFYAAVSIMALSIFVFVSSDFRTAFYFCLFVYICCCMLFLEKELKNWQNSSS